MPGKKRTAIRPPLPGNQRLSPANAARIVPVSENQREDKGHDERIPGEDQHDSDHPPTIASGVDCE